jgi:formylglycine-generating enzyme required for sulfatase activity
MGSELGQLDERPLRSVQVPTFHMMRSEVTISMYRACYDAGACSALSTFSSACTWSETPDSKEEYPASCMTWFQLRDFAEWVGARLPTEAEWEFAARGRGRDVVYPWGTDIPTCERATYFGCSDGMTVVCSLPDGNTPEGLCDMAGNVWEWVQDEYHSDYQGAPNDGSAWCATDGCEAEPVSAPFRVMRGGYWSGDADVMRASYRGSASPIVEYGFRGGRLAY